MTDPKASRSSAKARRSAARLAAVQTLYQSLMRGQTPAHAANQTIASMPLDEMGGEDLIVPNEEFQKEILHNVERDSHQLIALLKGALKDRDYAALEPLLRAILLAAASEMHAAQVDAPIIINDYVTIARAFYAGTEPGFINGVLQGMLTS